MKRRDFLKLVGIVIVAPGSAIVAVAKTKPKQRSKWRAYYAKPDALAGKKHIECKEAIKEFRFDPPLRYRGKRLYYIRDLST